MSDLATAAAGVDGSKTESQSSQATASDAGSVGGSSEAAPAWAGQLPADLKSNERLTQFAKLGDLGNAFLELDGKLAASIQIPGDGASEDEVKAYRTKRGVPTESKEYALTSLEELPDLGKFNELRGGMADWFAPKALEIGLTKTEAAATYRAWNERVKEQLATAEAQRQTAAKATRAVLQEELKDQYEPTMKRANALIKTVGGQELFDMLNETGLANDPRMIRFAAKIATMVGDDVLPGGEASGAKPWVTTKDGLPNMGYAPDDFKQ